MFTAYNIWYEDPDAVPGVNYKMGKMLPAGSAVRSVTIERSTITFVTDEGSRYGVVFEPAKHPGMVIDEFKDRMLIPRNFARMTREMTAEEVSCIRKGVIEPNLGKQAVLMVYGYPPEDQTPSVNSRVWQYPMSDSRTEAIRFDSHGMTIGTSAPEAESAQ